MFESRDSMITYYVFLFTIDPLQNFFSKFPAGKINLFKSVTSVKQKFDTS